MAGNDFYISQKGFFLPVPRTQMHLLKTQEGVAAITINANSNPVRKAITNTASY